MRPSVPPGPYLVAGAGQSGTAAAEVLARREGPEQVVVWDSSPGPAVDAAFDRLAALGISTTRAPGTAALRHQPRPRTVIRSPGVAPKVPLLAAARFAGLEVMDELELGWRLLPSRMLGVTGTNGKGTVMALARDLLRAAGHDAADAGNSDFAPPLCALAAGPPAWVACEASSYQLECCPELLPEIAVFTNFTRDHLNRHGTMQAYAACKRRMFVRGDRAVPLAVIGINQPFGRELAAEVAAREGRVLTFGREAASYRVAGCSWSASAGEVRLETPAGRLELHTRLPGPHNALNVAAGAALGAALGLDLATTTAVLEQFEPVPGRFELLEPNAPFEVIVDYAHNADGVVQATTTARSIVDSRGGRLLMMMSVPGLLDTPMRPVMGRTAARAADHLVITAGSTEGEAVEGLLAGPTEGAASLRGASFEVEPDRRAAMRKAIELAGPGDLVLITGRGSRPTLRMDISGSGPAFDDREVARELLAALPAAPVYG